MRNTTEKEGANATGPPDSAENLDTSSRAEWLEFIRQDAEEAKERRKPEAAAVFHAWLRNSQKSDLGLSVRAVLASVHTGTTGEELSGEDLDVLGALYSAILDTGRTRPNQATEHLIRGALSRLSESAAYWRYSMAAAAFRERHGSGR